MEIHSHGKNLKAHFPANQANRNIGSANELAKESGVARTEQTHPKSLLEQVESGEAVRKQLLAEIQIKVQSGEYLTRSAAVEAAEQIVGY